MLSRLRWAPLTLAFLFHACSPAKTSRTPPHLPLDLSTNEYRQKLASAQTQELLDAGTLAALEAGIAEAELQSLQAALDMGERSLKWIEHINSLRGEENKIRLTTRAGGLKGIPIETPSRYSPTIITGLHQANLEALDPVSRQVLLEGAVFSDNPGVPDEAFIEAAKKINKAYQSAARWQLVSPWLGYYEGISRRDVRGYYHLTQDKQIEEKLKTFETLEANEKTKILSWLNSLCRNSGLSVENCKADIAQAQELRTLRELYSRLHTAGRDTWRSFFDIGSARSDISWQSPLSARIPFRRHSESLLTEFVRSNVEEEFRWKGFGLNFDLRATNARESIPFVTFEPGATPHVKGLGGNHIVMDSNTPLTEWDVQWTIRHEFGHVVGLPDCYVEFFDGSAREMVNYQLDVTDLMCSRAGRMNERIYNELRRVYFQSP